jgi:hypothetical protein
LQLQILRLQAERAALKIGLFIKEIENQKGWTTQLTCRPAPSSNGGLMDCGCSVRFPPFPRSGSSTPPGGSGSVRRGLPMDLPDDYEHDYSHDPLFTEAVAKKVYYGPVYFKSRVYFEGGSPKPYMTLSLAGNRLDAGVSVAEIKLKLARN